VLTVLGAKDAIAGPPVGGLGGEKTAG